MGSHGDIHQRQPWRYCATTLSTSCSPSSVFRACPIRDTCGDAPGCPQGCIQPWGHVCPQGHGWARGHSSMPCCVPTVTHPHSIVTYLYGHPYVPTVTPGNNSPSATTLSPLSPLSATTLSLLPHHVPPSRPPCCPISATTLSLLSLQMPPPCPCCDHPKCHRSAPSVPPQEPPLSPYHHPNCHSLVP